ncbi:MAG TPA: ABC transporter permease [Rhizobiaceae bacterium]
MRPGRRPGRIPFSADLRGAGLTIFKLVIRRSLMSIVTLLLVSLIIFSMLEVLPGDVASRILGRDATPETLEQLRTELGLDRPAPVRYLAWLGALVTGDLGQSLASSRPVSEILAPRIFNTLMLSAYAFLIYLPLTIVPALLQALNRDRATDHAFSVVTLVLLSLPDFLLATILLLTFVVMVPILPAISLVDETSTAWEYLRAMTLPALTLAIVMAVYAVRMLRDNLVEVLDSDYIRMAELKGLSRRRVLLRHALPNALVPTLNVTALNLAYLVGGVVVVEKVFSYPGFGSLLVDSLQLRDLPVIEATVMIAAFVYVAANLIADVAAILLNPRLRTG